jgi:hypothetical protein
VYACLEGLLQRLNSSPPDVEALRLYLTIPQCRLFDNPINNNSLIVKFGEAILRLVANAGKVIGKQLEVKMMRNGLTLNCLILHVNKHRCCLYQLGTRLTPG